MIKGSVAKAILPFLRNQKVYHFLRFQKAGTGCFSDDVIALFDALAVEHHSASEDLAQAKSFLTESEIITISDSK